MVPGDQAAGMDSDEGLPHSVREELVNFEPFPPVNVAHQKRSTPAGASNDAQGLVYISFFSSFMFIQISCPCILSMSYL